MFKIPLFKPDYSSQERNALLKVFDDRWLAMGKYTKKFEEDFSCYLGENVESIAVSSCTAALHIALLAAGIKKGDEVIVPALTFVADINVVLMTGAKPVVVDSHSVNDWNVSFDDFSRKISSKTKAAIVVHFAGYPFDYRIIELCRRKNILLIEDCAHAVGSSVNGKMCGTLGDMAAFSFYANKNLAIGEGGMLVSHGKWIDKAKLLRSHGMTALSLERNLKRMITYDVVVPGLNYRITELGSAIGIEQLKKLKAGNEKRKKIVSKYISMLSNTNLIIPFREINKSVMPSFHIFPVLLPKDVNRKDFMQKMANSGIQTSIHYPSFRDFSGYQKKIYEKTPIADSISSQAVTLPLYPGLTNNEVIYICKSVKKIINNN